MQAAMRSAPWVRGTGQAAVIIFVRGNMTGRTSTVMTRQAPQGKSRRKRTLRVRRDSTSASTSKNSEKGLMQYGNESIES